MSISIALFFYRSRKLNMQLENAIQEAMTELDKYSEQESSPRSHTVKSKKINGKSSTRIGKSPTTTNSSNSSTSSSSRNRNTDHNRAAKNISTETPAKASKKPCR